MFRKLFRLRGKETSVNTLEKSIDSPVNDVEKKVDKMDTPVQETPRILLIDFDENTEKALTKRGMNCVSGSFGSIIRLPKLNRRDEINCRNRTNIPANFHEFEIAIINQADKEPEEYDESYHEFIGGKTSTALNFRCVYPQALFDQRPVGMMIYQEEFDELPHRSSILIVFASSFSRIEYTPMIMKRGKLDYTGQEEYSNYGFLPSVPPYENKSGTLIDVVTINEGLNKTLNKFKKDFYYKVVFEHPETRVDGEWKENPNFFPLMINSNGEVISYAQKYKESLILVFPQLKSPNNFLVDLLSENLPEISPSLFPFNTKFGWLKNPEYYLPNTARLIQNKRKIEEKYLLDIKSIDNELKENHLKYKFLHELLSESGGKLVKAVEKFFIYLEFIDVINCDELSPTTKEEDLLIESETGILVVEVKGIGGTSTDSECSQISKIKYRRARERNSFDVYGLYIVNHQRYLPPADRRNPPFSEDQIRDAINDERGLLSTYQLFRLYDYLENGLITREDVKSTLLNYGLVSFTPSNCESIGKPEELYYENSVGIFKLDNVMVRVGDEIIVTNGIDWKMTSLLSIMIDDKLVESINSGEVGLRFSNQITINSMIWIRKK